MSGMPQQPRLSGPEAVCTLDQLLNYGEVRACVDGHGSFKQALHTLQLPLPCRVLAAGSDGCACCASAHYTMLLETLWKRSDALHDAGIAAAAGGNEHLAYHWTPAAACKSHDRTEVGATGTAVARGGVGNAHACQAAHGRQ